MRVSFVMAVAVSGSLLAGCTGFRAAPETVPAFVTCPKPKTYPKAFQRQAAQELRDHGDKVPAVATLVGDYGALRQALRDCGVVIGPPK